MVVIKEPKTFYFDFDFPKNVDKNLKHEIEFTLKYNESYANNKMQKEIEYGNDSHEYGKQKNEWTAQIRLKKLE